MDISHIDQNCSGVYKIYCKANNKFYIGSGKNIYNRVEKHRTMLRGNYHDNPHLQAAYNKYSEGSFIVEIIELCSKANTLVREQYYLDTFKPWDSDIGFNIQKIVSGGYPGKQITLQNFSTGEIRTWNSRIEAAKHINCSACAISSVVVGRVNSAKGWGLPGVKKYGSGGHNKEKKVTLYNTYTKETKTWSSRKAAGEEIGAKGSVYALISGRCKTAKHIWVIPNRK